MPSLRAVAPCFCAAVLTGCGDPLLLGEALEERLGLLPAPEEPAWQVRWLGNEGLVPSCDLQAIDELDDEDIVFGEAFAEPPRFGAPTTWVDEGTFRYSVAFPVLVDAARFEEGEHLEIGDAERSGVWGVADELAWLVVEGDVQEGQDALLLDIDTPTPEPEGDFVYYAAGLVDATGTVEQQLAGLWEDDREWVEDGLIVLSLRVLDPDFDPIWAVVSGDTFGGMAPCR